MFLSKVNTTCLLLFGVRLTLQSAGDRLQTNTHATVQIQNLVILILPLEKSESRFFLGLMGVMICPEEHIQKIGLLISPWAIRDHPVPTLMIVFL